MENDTLELLSNLINKHLHHPYLARLQSIERPAHTHTSYYIMQRPKTNTYFKIKQLINTDKRCVTRLYLARLQSMDRPAHTHTSYYLY